MKRIFICLLIISFGRYLGAFQHQNYTSMSELHLKEVTLTLDLVKGTGPESENKFSYPYSLTVDNLGRIYVSDRGNRRIQVFSENGTFIRTIGGRKKRIVKLGVPKALAVDRNGQLFIGNFSRRRPFLISLTNDFELRGKIRIPFEASKIGFFNGHILLGTKSRMSGANIYIINPGGKILRTIDDVEDTELWKTRVNATFNNRGEIYLANEFSPHVRKYSADGRLLFEFQYQPLTNNIKHPQSYLAGNIISDGVSQPLCYDIAVDGAGFIYLLVSTDLKVNELSSLYRFNSNGKFLTSINLPILCSRLYIDFAERFYFLSQMETGFLYRYSSNIKKEEPQ